MGCELQQEANQQQVQEFLNCLQAPGAGFQQTMEYASEVPLLLMSIVIVSACLVLMRHDHWFIRYGCFAGFIYGSVMLFRGLAIMLET